MWSPIRILLRTLYVALLRTFAFCTLPSSSGRRHPHYDEIRNWIGFSSVLRPRQHSIGYMGDGFYKSKDPTNSIKLLKEHAVHRQRNAHRTGLSDTPVCECGNDIESAEHFLLYCSRYQEARVLGAALSFCYSVFWVLRAARLQLYAPVLRHWSPVINSAAVLSSL